MSNKTCVHLIAGMALAAGSILELAAPARAGNQINLPQAIDINPNPNIFETNIMALAMSVADQHTVRRDGHTVPLA